MQRLLVGIIIGLSLFLLTAYGATPMPNCLKKIALTCGETCEIQASAQTITEQQSQCLSLCIRKNANNLSTQCPINQDKSVTKKQCDQCRATYKQCKQYQESAATCNTALVICYFKYGCQPKTVT